MNIQACFAFRPGAVDLITFIYLFGPDLPDLHTGSSYRLSPANLHIMIFSISGILDLSILGLWKFWYLGVLGNTSFDECFVVELYFRVVKYINDLPQAPANSPSVTRFADHKKNYSPITGDNGRNEYGVSIKWMLDVTEQTLQEWSKTQYCF